MGSTCFKVVNEVADWFGASRRCREEDRAASLAILASPNDLDSLVFPGGVTNVWIGAYLDHSGECPLRRPLCAPCAPSRRRLLQLAPGCGWTAPR